MKTRLSLARIGVATVAGLLVLGAIGLALVGSLWDGMALAAGFTHAKFDLLLGKKELRIPAYRSSGRPTIPTSWFKRAGYDFSVKRYICVGSTSCYAYHETYDAQVRKAIIRDFGYDIFAEFAADRFRNVTIMVQHE